MISDLADEAVKAGTYVIEVTIDDSHDIVTYKITMLIKDAPITPPSTESASSTVAAT